MNGQVGPLLDLTWEDVKRIKKHGKLKSNYHKTGHYYNQEIEIHQEQFPWFKCRVQEEARLSSKTSFWHVIGYKRLFFGCHNTESPREKFDEKSPENDYQATPIRKMCITYMHYKADQIPAEARAFHAIHSSHRPDTAEKNYIMPKTSGIDFYHDTLKGNTASPVS